MSSKRMMEYKLVVAVRQDIDLSPGKMAAQVAHAAVACAIKAKSMRRELYEDWMKEGQRKVVLKVRDLVELEQIERSARAAGIIVDKIADAGLTEVPPGTVTCLGLGPASESDLDKITGHLKLA